MHFHYKKIKGLFQVFWNIFFESSMHSLESKSSSGLQFKVVASLAMIRKDALSIFPGIWSNAWMVRTFTPEAFESLPCENPLLSRTFLKFVIAFLPHFHVFFLIISSQSQFVKMRKAVQMNRFPKYKTKKTRKAIKDCNSFISQFQKINKFLKKSKKK